MSRYGYLGCTNNCKGCFNPESHCFDAGRPFTDETMDKLIKAVEDPNCNALTITGGDPLHPRNCKTVKEIIRKVKCLKDPRGIWIWTRIRIWKIK